MRKLIWIMLAIIVLQACDQNSKVYNIEVSLDGSEGKWIKLLAREDRAYVSKRGRYGGFHPPTG